jgi:WS/DGAT/MGAT family acyltransferase
MIGERLHLLPPFRWKLARVPLGLDMPYWVEDPDFDLDFHVRETAVPPGADARRIAETVARIFARPLDRSRPLWELYLVHGLAEGRVALLTKVHHAAVDGVSGHEILAILLDPSPEGREIPPPEGDGDDAGQPGRLELLGRGLAGLARQPVRAVRSVPRAVPNLVEVPGANSFPGVPALSGALTRLRGGRGRTDERLLEVTTARAPRTSFNGPISAHRRFAYGSVSLDAVKDVKNAFGTTVNDVVVTLCTAAVREYLLDRGELPEDPLVAMVPVSVRAPEEFGTFGNKVSAMIVPIPTDEPDAHRRLIRAHEMLRTAKEHHKALPASLMTDATAFIPPAVHALAARTTVQVLGRALRPPVNLVISNVPGPREPLYCAGAELEANHPVSAIVDGVGLNITVLSYRDHVDVGIVSDRNQLDDPWLLMSGIRRALAELHERANTT